MEGLLPLDDEDKLVEWLASYEILPLSSRCVSSEGYERVKREIRSRLKDSNILDSDRSKINSEFLEEFEGFKDLIEEGCTVERAVCLARQSSNTFLFDELSTKYQELFIWLMEKNWENTEKIE